MKLLYTLLFIICTTSFLFAQELYFPPTSGSEWETIQPESLQWCQENIDSLYTYLENNNSKAFILLKDGKIVLEKYFNNHNWVKSWYWASAGKTLTSFLIGLAQEDGDLSIENMTSDYLGEGWTDCTLEQESKITIRNQLTMTSGLDDGVSDPYCTDPDCLHCIADAGNRWAYHNAPYTLLRDVLENATNLNINIYITQKLKSITGMNGAFIKAGFNNIYYSNARSMARFGLMILNEGNWNGNQIMNDVDYYESMISTSQDINKSYGYLWWLNGKSEFMIPTSQVVYDGPIFPNAPDDMFSALGANGQFLNIIPGKNMVMIRMGQSPDSTAIPFQLNNEIWKFIDRFDCGSVSTNSAVKTKRVRISPNPASDILRIDTDKLVKEYKVIGLNGIVIESNRLNHNKIDISSFPPGVYTLRLEFDDGTNGINKFTKVE